MFVNQQFARLVMMSDNPCLDELVQLVLRGLLRRVSADGAMLHLSDGSSIMQIASVNLLVQDRRSAASPGLLPGCALGGTRVAEDGFHCGLGCPAAPGLEKAGFKSHACVPLRLGTGTIGALAMLFRSPRDFAREELDDMEATAKRLALEMHHVSLFPEFCTDWVALEGSSGDVWRSQRAWTDGTGTCRMGLVSRVLALENLNQDALASTLTDALPKGVNWPTLNRVCEYLEQHSGSLSRKDLATALGFSEITAGTYLTYLADTGILDMDMVYGQVGRPPFIYRLQGTSDPSEPKEEQWTSPVPLQDSGDRVNP